jgi:hypothetical protein
MKKIIVAILLLVTSVSYAARFQSEKAVFCDDLDIVLNILQGPEMQEKIIWTATDIENDTKYILFVNEKKNTWTYVQHNNKVACVLGAGYDSTFNFGTSI